MRRVFSWLALGLLALSVRGAAAEPPLSLVVLGSGGPGAVGRASAGFLVQIDGVPRILVDAGPGTFARLGETGLSLAKTDIIMAARASLFPATSIPRVMTILKPLPPAPLCWCSMQ